MSDRIQVVLTKGAIAFSKLQLLKGCYQIKDIISNN